MPKAFPEEFRRDVVAVRSPGVECRDLAFARVIRGNVFFPTWWKEE